VRSTVLDVVVIEVLVVSTVADVVVVVLTVVVVVDVMWLFGVHSMSSWLR
jgi:cellobiose-specific phosphotransferase system component IIC